MTIRPRKAILGLGLATCFALTLAGCAGITVEKAGSESKTPEPSASGQTPKVETVREGQLTICTNPPYYPFEATDGTVVTGFDMDLTAEVARDLDLEIDYVITAFEAIESAAALDTGTCDIGASALSITEARSAKLDFSTSYYTTTMGLLVKADSGITDVAGLAGKPVGVQQGTTGERWARSQPELTDIKQFEGLGDQVTALQAGDVVGIFNDTPTLVEYEDKGFAIVGQFDAGGEPEVFGLAVKKGNTALLSQINKTLERITGDGTYDELLAKWRLAEK
ncbi:MAG: ABC transporter substrate-binding protein [Bifidobacteriaceae bacterium]|jgi:polar amino acid transport system substrate-binding protein|nr:ABC transporter substrate-binding protein [Bifidobacteriaceae bacterium]